MLPPLINNQINVFISQVDSHIDAQLNDLYLSYLSPFELKKYHSFHFDKDKNLYLLAHAMLNSVLSEYFNCSLQSIEYKVNKYGKPALKTNTGIQFNLSHSKTAVALVVSNDNQQELGVDIEHQERGGNLLEMAEHFFSKDETALLFNQVEENRTETFFKLWTLKEAYIKAIGKGLSIDLDCFSFSSLEQDIQIRHYNKQEQYNRWDFFNSQVFKNFQLSIASRKQLSDAKQPQIKTFKLIPTDTCKSIDLNFTCSPTVL